MPNADLVPKDFMRSHRGLLREEHFPAEDGEGSTLDDDLAGEDGWIAEAWRKTDGLKARRREAATAFVYWRAYFDIYSRMSGEPTRTDAEGGVTISYDRRQAERFKSLADDFKDDFDDINGGRAGVAAPEPEIQPPTSRSAAVRR